MTNNTLTVVTFYLLTLIKEKLSSLLLGMGRDETRLKEILMNSENQVIKDKNCVCFYIKAK